jgi:hypothetical protein
MQMAKNQYYERVMKLGKIMIWEDGASINLVREIFPT